MHSRDRVIAPTVTLGAELMELHAFLTNQKPNGDVDAAIKAMNKKEIEAKKRELENWNFRLYLDEGKEMQRGQQLKILSSDFPMGTHVKGGTKSATAVSLSPSTNGTVGNGLGRSSSSTTSKRLRRV
ncbi:hypothetical protein AaE_014712 [Aphanomyces astaci]|uniref:Uncharacterized protein n=1 Tax=Aphanomyces astaci TaxID=112090 RepID=A0A6A4Z632_APHAT|nr:hypothetical protein AaE_014712 [Aphanomyces astaci]